MGNNVVTKLPHELGQLEKLRSLDVSKNKLKLLPPDLGELHEVLVEFSTSLNPCSCSLPLPLICVIIRCALTMRETCVQSSRSWI